LIFNSLLIVGITSYMADSPFGFSMPVLHVKRPHVQEAEQEYDGRVGLLARRGQFPPLDSRGLRHGDLEGALPTSPDELFCYSLLGVRSVIIASVESMPVRRRKLYGSDGLRSRNST
jgi:hypothetical protein